MKAGVLETPLRVRTRQARMSYFRFRRRWVLLSVRNWHSG